MQKKVERLAYFTLHPADYLLDTGDLSFAEHGVYCTLMFRYYWNGTLTQSDRYRGCRTPEDRVAVDAVIARFFHEDGERLVHNRIERELAKISEYVEHQSKAGKASAEKRWGGKKKKNAEKPPKEPRGKRPLPPDWTPSAELLAALGTQYGWKNGDAEKYTAAFKDACAAKGYQYADFNAAFRNCVRTDWPKLRTAQPAAPTNPLYQRGKAVM